MAGWRPTSHCQIRTRWLQLSCVGDRSPKDVISSCSMLWTAATKKVEPVSTSVTAQVSLPVSALFFTAAEISKDKQATHSKKGWLKVNGKRFCCRARFGVNTALVFQHVGTICCPSKHCDTQYYFKLLFKTVIYIIYGWYYDNVA